MQRRAFIGAAALAPFAAHLPALAQNGWPQRPVRWIVSSAAGSGPDILARYLADQLGRKWPQPVIVENRPGGQNVIGAQAAARSAPDGYTYYFATTAAMVTNVFTFKALPYDPAKDFAPVRLVGRSPFIIATAAGSPFKSLADVVAQAKANPGQVAIATEGPKQFSGMLADAVASMAGVKLNHVPYTKAPEALQDVVGGRTPLVCLPYAGIKAFLESGQVRALAVSTPRRLPDMPNVPALSETFPGFEYTGWNGLFAPAGTPADIVARVNRDLEAVVQQPEVAERIKSLGSLPETRMGVAEFEAFMKAERERWAGLVKTLGISAE
ncbi:tripartite tricarboxylate transporter substrate binding protein [Ramlibacter sp. AW1]|uniref:Tripartite tricarboxylate transporter substrate binding protein n=1 Tax=Ramlibacter aurantiacus TaxID=2801330 RepID=A0A936ZHH5_9BURK|nr:tripartite tricarboxylate transporter substrate binding protein [Ramlibacter aurantiacus]MBL0421002.1 tripartite tricarboxylate transporter substrate binding protein [Ramlibacter aurantiacus]